MILRPRPCHHGLKTKILSQRLRDKDQYFVTKVLRLRPWLNELKFQDFEITRLLYCDRDVFDVVVTHSSGKSTNAL